MGSTTTPIPEPYWITEGRKAGTGPGWLVGSMAWSTAEWFATYAEALDWLGGLLWVAASAQRRVVQ